MVWLLIAILLLVPYTVLLFLYRKWLGQLPATKPPVDFVPAVQFSILIPARNEADHIQTCLQSVQKLNYPALLYEVIVIDDFSTDDTAALAKQFSNIKVISLKDIVKEPINSYKKKAIETGIQYATGTYIVTTDADCIVPAAWLRNFAWMIEQQKSMFIAAPVAMKEESSFIKLFQSLDFMSLQGITAASVGAGFHSMCNGANLCYSKQAFTSVDGFANIDHIASGDDMLLMYKMYKQFPASVHYCNSANSIVLTNPVATVGEFFNQRIRWASKADKYDDKRIFWVLLLVYLLNAYLLVLFLAALFVPALWLLLTTCFVIKTLVELIFMIPVASFFKKERLLVWFPLMQPFHILYTVIAGWLGKFGNYEWKGRKTR
jgi:cellulose synthase/poly-beta-1,6-N-acetylglucosamine synthase-like glycosyltransferase